MVHAGESILSVAYVGSRRTGSRRYITIVIKPGLAAELVIGP